MKSEIYQKKGKAIFCNYCGCFCDENEMAELELCKKCDLIIASIARKISDAEDERLIKELKEIPPVKAAENEVALDESIRLFCGDIIGVELRRIERDLGLLIGVLEDFLNKSPLVDTIIRIQTYIREEIDKTPR